MFCELDENATRTEWIKIGDQKVHHVIAWNTNYEWFYSMNLALKFSLSIFYIYSEWGSNVTSHEFYAWNLVVNFNFDLEERKKKWNLNSLYPSWEIVLIFFLIFHFNDLQWKSKSVIWQSTCEHKIWFWDTICNKVCTLSLTHRPALAKIKT